MKEPYREGPASRPDPESCMDGRKAGREASTGERADQPSSCEIRSSGVPTPLSEAEGNIEDGARREPSSDPAQSKTLRMRESSSHENREIPEVPAPDGGVGRPEKVKDQESGMDASGKSDGRVVPMKGSNKGGRPPAETVEGSRPTKGNRQQTAASRTQSRDSASTGLLKVREDPSEIFFANHPR